MTEVYENVQVAMLFRGEDVRPSAFLWNGHRYDVKRILLVHKVKTGEVLSWYFTVETASGTMAKLAFDTMSLMWRLTEIEQLVA